MPTATTGTNPPQTGDPPGIIALTGIPGTGKTTTSHLLGPPITVVDANTLAEDAHAIEHEDEARNARIVDEAKLAQEARKKLPSPPVLIEGHLSHHCDPDAVVLLRCHPDELRDRLEDRGWPEAKVEENVMAETLDALIHEVKTCPAWEADTTNTPPETIAQAIQALFEGEAQGILEPLGSADWTDTLTGGSPT